MMENLLVNVIALLLIAGAILIAVIVGLAYVLLRVGVISDRISSAAENWHMVHPHMKVALLAFGIAACVGFSALIFFAPGGHL